MRMEENYFTFVLPLYVFCSLAECTVSQGNTKPLSANVYAKKKKHCQTLSSEQSSSLGPAVSTFILKFVTELAVALSY